MAGQEIMTADKVTLRLNAVVTYKVADPVKAVTTVEDSALASPASGSKWSVLTRFHVHIDDSGRVELSPEPPVRQP